MTFYPKLWLLMTISILGAASAVGQEEKRGDSTALQMAVFFVEDKPIEGHTERGAVRVGEGSGEPVYLHKTPALFANVKTVQSFTLSSTDLSDLSPGQVHFNFTLHFTADARKKLAKTLEGKGTQMRHVTVFIGGKRFGMQRYEVTNSGPEMCRAETFSLLFSLRSKPETLQVVDTLLRNETRTPKGTRSK